MTLTADSKKRVVLPSAAPGDVFVCHETAEGIILQRVYRQQPRRKLTKAQALKAIQGSSFKPALGWDELRTITREP